MVSVSVFDPKLLVAVSVTVYVPLVVYRWLGFCVVAVPPSPKFQLHEVGPLVDRSVKETTPVQLEVTLAEKLATGGVEIDWQPSELRSETLEPPALNKERLRAFCPLVNIYIQASSV